MNSNFANFIARFAVSTVKTCLTAAVTWFHNVYEATGLTSLWIAVVILAVAFSIFILPLRGGSDVSQGAIGDFVTTSIHTKKSKQAAAERKARYEETRRYRARQMEYYRRRSGGK